MDVKWQPGSPAFWKRFGDAVMQLLPGVDRLDWLEPMDGADRYWRILDIAEILGWSVVSTTRQGRFVAYIQRPDAPSPLVARMRNIPVVRVETFGISPDLVVAEGILDAIASEKRMEQLAPAARLAPPTDEPQPVPEIPEFADRALGSTTKA